MARLATLAVTAVNGATLPAIVTYLIQSELVQKLTANTVTSLSDVLYNKNGTISSPVQTLSSATTVANIITELNTDNTTNTTTIIPVTVQKYNGSAWVTDYTLNIPVPAIRMVYAAPDSAADSMFQYADQFGNIYTVRVDETVAAIKTAANA